ncbi:MAG: LemA family protein [Bacteroidales bacterium]|nr:LemA family protein [Bacteroidales bacterium]
MANLLDEKTGPVNKEGREINVIDKQLPAEVGFGSLLFEIALWVTVPALVVAYVFGIGVPPENKVLILAGGCLLGLLPGLIFQFMKVKAHNYFQQLEQKIQAEASTIDNFLEQRVVVLENLEALVSRAIELDKDVMKSVAALRSGVQAGAERNELTAKVNESYGGLMMHMEAYPELRAHEEIADAIQQNSYLQKEISAARTVYNNRVSQWNRDIFDWPTRQIVAAREGYTTRIPYNVASDIKEQARKKFF